MAKYELSLTSGNVFSTPVTLTVTPTEGPSVTVSGSSAISTPVELAVLNSIGPRGETGPQGPQGPQGIQGSPGDSVNLQIFDGNIAVGQSVLTTDDVTFNSVTTTGDVTVGGVLNATVNGPFVGDFTARAGETVDVSAGTLTLADNQISGDKVEGGTIDAITINTLTSTSISGDLTGDVTGDVTGNLTGNVTGNVTGDVTGNLTGNVTGNVTGDLTGNADTADALTFIVRNSTGATLTKGTAVYVSGIQGNTPEVSPARADSSATMPAFGLVQADIAASGNGVVTTFGSLLGLDIANFGETGVTFSLGDTVYISATEAGKLTNAAPAGEANSIQNIGKIERATPTTNMTIKVGGAGRTNATPNLDDGDIFIGNSSNQAVTSDLNSEVRSRVSASGDLNYNQATGDFSFTERTDAEVRGLISSTDNGGDGSLSYDSTTGIISYTGPNASEVRAHFSGGTGVTITNGEVAIGQPVATTDDVTFDDVTLTGQLKGPATFTIDPAAHGDDTGTVVVAGNLQVDGTTTTINSTIVEIDDLNLKLAAEATTNAQANGAGITVGDGLANITYNSGTDRWVLDKELSADVVGTVSGDVTGNVTGNLTGNVTGTVSTLTNHDTDDLAEGTTNLYYTPARANTDFDTRLATKTTSDLTEGTNLYYTDARDTANFNTNLATKTTSDLTEGTNLYYTDARADARVNLQTGTNLDLSSKTTSDLAEGTNLYYTAARFDTAFGNKSTSDLSEGTNLYYTATRFDTAFGAKDTDDLSEGLTNLYYTDARDTANFTTNLAASDTDDLSEGLTNLYYTSARANTDFDTRLATKTTSDLAEGTNLYYTDARADARVNTANVTASGAVMDSELTSEASVKALNQGVATTDSPTFVNTILTGYLAGPATFTIDPAAVGDNTGKVVIAGDLQVDGTTTTVNSTTVEVSDKNVVLGADATADTQNHGAGITVSRPDSTDAGISWDETNDEWDVSNGLDVAGNIKVSGTVDGRTIATDGTKLDTIETNADVTDTANVTAAGALMDSEVTNLAQVKAFDSADYATAAQGATADTAVQPNDSPTFGTITADGLNLGDNEKVQLGASNDLQIYHDGSNSYIHDAGTGNLNIRADDIRIEDGSSNAYFLGQSGVSYLLNGGVTKLNTTSTGVDVTGDVTVGLNDAFQVGSSSTSLARTNSGNDLTLQHWGNLSFLIDNDANDVTRTLLIGKNSTDRSTAEAIALFEENGDISFYEDTGTTAKFFWDASAESLGIGTTSPQRIIHTKSSVPAIRLEDSDVSGLYHEIVGTAAGSVQFKVDAGDVQANTNLQFYVDGVERAEVNPSGVDVAGTVTADTFSFANWTVTESGGSLYFATGGTNKMKLDASGNLQVVGNVESNATIS